MYRTQHEMEEEKESGMIMLSEPQPAYYPA